MEKTVKDILSSVCFNSDWKKLPSNANLDKIGNSLAIAYVIAVKENSSNVELIHDALEWLQEMYEVNIDFYNIIEMFEEKEEQEKKEQENGK